MSYLNVLKVGVQHHVHGWGHYIVAPPTNSFRKDSGVTLANRAADVNCLTTTLTWGADYIAGGDF